MSVIIVDNADSSIGYSGQWVNTPSPTGNSSQFFGGTTSSETLNGGLIIYQFNGVSVSIWGSRPLTNATQISASIDGVLARDPSPGLNGATYTSPTLRDGSHLLTIAGTQSNDVDFLTVTTGPSTVLKAQLRIVDDADSTLAYSGSWGTFLDSQHPVKPYQNTVHWTKTPGDSITFQFTGSYFAVYGILNTQDAGTVTSTISVDGNAPGKYTATYPGGGADGSLENTKFFYDNSTIVGSHRVVLTVTEVTGAQAFGFDYIVHNGVAAAPASTVPKPTPSSTPGSAPASNTHKSSSPAGAIAGGVIGGLVLIVLIYGAFKRWRKSEIKTTFDVKRPEVVLPPAIQQKASFVKAATVELPRENDSPVVFHTYQGYPEPSSDSVPANRPDNLTYSIPAHPSFSLATPPSVGSQPYHLPPEI